MSSTLTTTEEQIEQLAGEALSHLGGDPFIHDGAPEWVRSLVHAATQYWPDEYQRDFLTDALQAISDAHGDLDEASEYLGEVGVYYSSGLAWLASDNNRLGYCDDALSEWGVSSFDGVYSIIQRGMYTEQREILDAAGRFLADQADELDDLDDDEPEEDESEEDDESGDQE